MKIIDLLNKIANGEEVPKKFIIKGSCFKDLYFEYNEKYNCYDLIGENFKNGCYVFGYSELNDTIETLEEKKKIPEKLDWNKNDFTYPEGNLMSEETADMLMEIQDKVNFILDYLKSKGE